MATDFYTRSGGGRHKIVLETDRLEHFKFMRTAAEICVDGKHATFAPVVHGRWIIGKGNKYRECSCCHYIFARLHPNNYCPNCGANMKEED
jgi:rubrerythrin